MLGFIPGMSIDDIARRELENQDLNKYGTGFDDTKRGAFNWQDQFGAFLAGGTKEDVLKRAQQLRDQKLSNTYDDAGALTRTALKSRGLQPTYAGVTRKSEQQIRDAQADDAARLAAYSQLAGTKGYKPGLVSDSADVIQINTATRNLLEEEEQRKIDKAEDRRLDEIRRSDQRYDTERADRLAERADALQFQRDQLLREDMRYNERLEREERNRRQESIMAMMSGLASLGAAFAM